jgi:hypothetical protein
MTLENPITDYQALVERCWSDPEFKKRLVADPIGVLKEAGYEFPQGMSVQIHENHTHSIGMVIPSRPADLSDTELESISGGNAGILLFGRVSEAARVLGTGGAASTGAASGLGKVAGLTVGGLAVGGGATYALLKALGEK